MIRIILGFLLVAFLGACSSNNDNAANGISCPQIYILKGTDRLARFLPDGKKPTVDNLIFEARSTFGDGECAYKRNQLAVKFLIGAYVRKADLFDVDESAPFNEQLEMFVGVRDKGGNIVSRQVVPIAFDEAEERDEETAGTPLLRAFFRDKRDYDDAYPADLLRISREVDVDVPSAPGGNPRDYRIYIGFLISESELAYNRKGYLPNF